MKNLSDIIKELGLTMKSERVSTLEPQYIFSEDDYKYAWKNTVLFKGKETEFYFFSQSEMIIDEVFEQLITTFNFYKEYTAKEWLIGLGGQRTLGEWDEEMEKEKRARKISKEYKTKLIELVGLGNYLKLVKASKNN